MTTRSRLLSPARMSPVEWSALMLPDAGAADPTGTVPPLSLPTSAQGGFITGPHGVGLNFLNTDFASTTGAIVPGISGGLTAVQIVEPTGSASLTGNFMFAESAASGGAYNWGFYSNGGGYPAAFIHNGTTGVAAIATFYTWLAYRRPQVWVMTYGDGDNNIRIYVDGIEYGTGAQTGNIRRDTSAHLSVQRWTTAGSDHALYGAGVTNRRMTAAEVQARFSTVDEAMRQLRVRRRRYWAVSAGASTYTLSAPTYVPGSITSTGLTARVTVTAA